MPASASADTQRQARRRPAPIPARSPALGLTTSEQPGPAPVSCGSTASAGLVESAATSRKTSATPDRSVRTGGTWMTMTASTSVAANASPSTRPTSSPPASQWTRKGRCTVRMPEESPGPWCAAAAPWSSIPAPPAVRAGAAALANRAATSSSPEIAGLQHPLSPRQFVHDRIGECIRTLAATRQVSTAATGLRRASRRNDPGELARIAQALPVQQHHRGRVVSLPVLQQVVAGHVDPHPGRDERRQSSLRAVISSRRSRRGFPRFAEESDPAAAGNDLRQARVEAAPADRC